MAQSMFLPELRCLISNFNIIFSAPITPFINRQPQIYIPTCLDKHNPEGLTTPVYDLEGNTRRNRMIGIQFSVNYKDALMNIKERPSKYFKLQFTKLYIYKYSRKTSLGEVYDENTHKQEYIGPIESKTEMAYNFNVFIASYTYKTPKHGLNRGCQLISIHKDFPMGLNYTTQMVKDSINDFKKLFGVEIDNNVAICFTIVTEMSRRIRDMDRIPSIKSDLFKFVFNDDGCSVNLVPVDPNEYHVDDIS